MVFFAQYARVRYYVEYLLLEEQWAIDNKDFDDYGSFGQTINWFEMVASNVLYVFI